MLSLNGHHRYFVFGQATDMRKGFDGLSGLVRQYFESDLMSGDVFVFVNRRGDRIKLLSWDQTGFAIFYKRLESGRFQLPAKGDNNTIQLSWPELAMLLEGFEIKAIKRRKRYRKRA